MSLRWIIASFATHLGYGYGAYRSLKSPHGRDCVFLWCLLALIEAVTHFPPVSYIVQLMPFFWELRMIVVWSLLSLPPDTIERLFHALVAPSVKSLSAPEAMGGVGRLVGRRVAQISLHALRRLVPTLVADAGQVYDADRSLATLEHLFDVASPTAGTVVAAGSEKRSVA